VKLSLRNRRLFNLLVGTALSGGFLWIALRGLDLRATGQILIRARWGYLPAIFVIWWFGLFVRAVRWYILLDERLPLRPVFHISNIRLLVNNVIPLRIGELLRALLVVREGAPVSALAVLSTVFTERILDVLALVVMLVMVLPLLPVSAAAVQGGLLIGAAALGGFLLLLVMASYPAVPHRLLGRFIQRLPFLKRFKLSDFLSQALDGLKPLTSLRGLLRLSLWTVVVWLVTAAEAWAVTLLFPDWPSHAVPGLVLTVVLASLSFLIPFTPAGAGPFEAAAIFALTTASVSPEMAAAFAVAWHSSILLYYVLWGGIGLVAMHLSPGQLLRVRQNRVSEVHL
jgi:uncharacterized protein (TIRG00374 family)